MIFLFITFLFSQTFDSLSLNYIKNGLKILGVEEEELGYEKRWATDTLYRLFIIDSLFKKPLAVPKYLDKNVSFLNANKDSLVKTYLFLLDQLKRKDFKGFSEKKESGKIKKEIESKIRTFKKSAIENENLYYLIAAFLVGDSYYKKALSKLKEEEIHILLAEIPYLFSDEEASEDNYLRGAILKEYNIFYDTTKEIELETLFGILRKVEMIDLYRANLSYLIGIEKFLKEIKNFSVEKDFEDLEIEGVSVALGGKKNNLYNKDYRIIIDFGGNDYYSVKNRGIVKENLSSLIIDLEGNDFYYSADIGALGNGFLGSGFLFDFAGNDIYYAEDFSLGSGILGVGILWDLAGDDIYRGKTFSCGSGFYGLGVIFDYSGNDNYQIYNFGQGFGSTFGYGLLFDLEGNDVYYAGGKYLHIPLLPNDYRSFSQGFAIGFRPDVSGGIGFLCDMAGNDFYNGDVFTQGCSYWYSLGMLYDGKGNDKYYATEYAQGAGIHLAIGILVDSCGEDSYYSRLGPAQGEGHDLAVGILIDNDGDDFYYASGGQGIGLTNSFGLLLDKNGDDLYFNREEKFGQGFANQARGFGGIGLFIDLKGNDLYGKRGMGEDGSIWTSGIYAYGIDELKEKEKKIEEEDTTVKDFGKMKIEELFKYASKWEVGSAKKVVRDARMELIKRKEEAIEYIVKKKLSTKDGLELRAIEEVACSLPSLIKPYLIDSINSENSQTRANVIYLIGKIKAKEAIPSLVKALKDKRNKPRWILNAFAEIGDTSVFFEIINYLNSVDEPTRIYACYALGKLKDKRGTNYLIEKLKDPIFTVRQSAEIALAEIGTSALPVLLDNLSKNKNENFQANILRVINRIIPQLDSLKNLKERVEIKNILISYLDKENLSLKSSAIEGLSLFNEKEIKEILKKRIPFESNPLILRKLKESVGEL
ncbi:MAG: HEAT repeat domain-containing protein [candidate division WOR-3 bacterium]